MCHSPFQDLPENEKLRDSFLEEVFGESLEAEMVTELGDAEQFFRSEALALDPELETVFDDLSA